MRIIIDGVDKSGKSTLIEALKNKIPNAIMVKLLSKPKDKETGPTYIKTMYAKMAELTRDVNTNFVFDRWYPSEMVYSFKRGYDALEDGWFYKMENELRKTDGFYILVEADPALVAKRFKTAKEDFAKVEEIEKLQERYREHYKNCQLHKIKVDTTNSLDAVVQQILDAIEEIKKPKTIDFSEEK